MARGRGFILQQKRAHQLVQRGAVIQVAALCRCLDLANQREQALGVAIQQIKQNRLFGPVIVIKARLGCAAGGGDVIHAGGRITFVGKARGGGVQNVIALEFEGS